MKSRLLVIAIGNEFRCDDGAALVAARRLRQQAGDFEVVEHTGDGAELLDLWQNADTVILLDAVQSGAPAGTIHRFEIEEDFIPSAGFPEGTHTFNLLQAIDLARVLGLLPPMLVLYGIEGERFQYGTELSIPVQRAIEKLVAEVMDYSALYQ